MKHWELLIMLLGALIFLESCKEDEPGYSYEIPSVRDDGWAVDSADLTGLKSSQLVEMVDYLESRYEHQIHSIVIVKNDKLIFEKYFEGYLYSKRSARIKW